mmetsp:Transcript_7344/g.26113  ORF Transcript_7344/g.26113 Transcript_7344/m.26113 type:complete len:91 (-) Transcript_7344:14-286(-)
MGGAGMGRGADDTFLKHTHAGARVIELRFIQQLEGQNETMMLTISLSQGWNGRCHVAHLLGIKIRMTVVKEELALSFRGCDKQTLMLGLP